MIDSVYNLLVQLGTKALPLYPNKKVYELVTAQNKNWEKLSSFNFNSPIWFHIASSGEFEQAKPVIEKIKEQGYQIIVTFFSPSGFKAHENNKLLNGVFYLPFDTKKNVDRFLSLVRPKMCVLVKYDFWLNYLKALHHKNIPVCLISGLLTNNHFLFKWYGKSHLNQIEKFAYISVQNKATQLLLQQRGIESDVTGDTRIDRSLELPEVSYSNEIIHQFSQKATTIILGSAWEKDLELFQEHLKIITKRGGKLIIAPHELNDSFLQSIVNNFEAVRISTANEKELQDCNALLIDQVGILKYIYRYADIAYIGGGFGKGIHNTLEPAAYGLPIVFGPNFKKFIEAVEMAKKGAAFPVKDKLDLIETLAWLLIEENRQAAGKKAKLYLQSNQGASQTVANNLIKIMNKYDAKLAETH